ncbi:MAG: hypothetical protein KJS98_17425, partial [Nitrospirae bacterium]|nr:hypothetical protein [Nitrospirota bacterium]
DYFLPDLSNPTFRAVLAATGVIVLFPLGIYFLFRAVKEPLRASSIEITPGWLSFKPRQNYRSHADSAPRVKSV